MDQTKEEIIKTDIEFSNTSVSEGISSAFIKFAADDVVLLRDRKFPVMGIESLKEHFAESDTSVLLEWKPWKADAAESGDMGYTTGNWKLTITDSTGRTSTRYGNYVSIWKKINDIWKYVLDGGNNTPDNPEF